MAQSNPETKDESDFFFFKEGDKISDIISPLKTIRRLNESRTAIVGKHHPLVKEYHIVFESTKY